MKKTLEEYCNISAPTLLLRCTLPQSWLEIRERLSTEMRKNPNIMIKNVKNTSHMIHWDNPYTVIQEIKDWLK